MDEVLVAAVREAPSLVVLMIVVRMFLSHLKERDEALKRRDTVMIDAMNKINLDNLDARQSSRSVISKDVAVIERLAEGKGELAETLRQFSAAISKCQACRDLASKKPE